MGPALLFIASIGVTMPEGISEPPKAITLSIQTRGDVTEVSLEGNSPVDQRVEYSIEMTGSSTSRHRGKTSLTANVPVVLSTMRMQTAGDWCVTIDVTEENGRNYRYTRGASCSA